MAPTTKFSDVYEVRDGDGNRHAIFDKQGDAEEFVDERTAPPANVDDDVRVLPTYTITKARAQVYGDEAPGDVKSHHKASTSDAHSE